MNKAELIDSIADRAGLSKKDASNSLDALIDTVTEALAANDKVSISRLGTFTKGFRAARAGRNPQTGATIQIAASSTAKFKAAKELKEAVQDVETA